MFFGPSKRHSALLLVVAFVAAAGCDSPRSSGANVDAGANGEPGGRDGSTDGPDDPSVLPGGYAPHIECGALGNTCDANSPCSDGLFCQAGVCLPDLDATQSATCAGDACPIDVPLCVFGVCVTADQLACVCLDRSGRDRVSQCASIWDSDPGSQCLPADSLCDTSPEACCEGFSCLRGKDADDEPLLGLCKQPCDDDSECESGCCTEAEGIAGKFCAAALSMCIGECRELNEECDGLRRPCCEGLVCARSATDPELAGCQLSCVKNSECESGCCVLFQGRDNGVCGPADRCEGQ
jgi:hypothetical protein